MILQEEITKAAASTTSSGLLFKLKLLAASAVGAVENHPGVAVTAGIASSLIALMQSAQEVVASLIALVTSIGGLVVAALAVRSTWKNRNKRKKE